MGDVIFIIAAVVGLLVGMKASVVFWDWRNRNKARHHDEEGASDG